MDDHPEDIAWSLLDICPGSTTIPPNPGRVAYGEDYVEKGKLESKVVTVRKSRYMFVMVDTSGDGMCCSNGPPGSYMVYFDNVLQAQGGEFNGAETKFFGECADA